MNIKRLILFFSFIFLFLISTNNIYAQVIFSDDFNDNDSNGWIVPRNTCTSNWFTDSNKYGIIISGGCVTETIPSSLIITSGINYIFEVDMTMSQNSNMDRNFVFKYKDSSNWYGIHTLNNELYLQKVVDGTEYVLPNRKTTYYFESNKTYHFQIDVYSDIFTIYINGVYLTSVSDQSPYFNNYSAGLQASAGGITDSEVWFDNVIVTEISNLTPTPNITPSSTPTNSPTTSPSTTSTPTNSPSPTTESTSTPTLPSLNVLDLKQYSGGWEEETYDHTTKTIKNWGCALTSAAMILQYYGHNIFPDVLNTWLNNQKDGYFGNGLINWLAISRYTFLNKTINSSALEYRRIDPTIVNLNNELANNRPVILKEPGHFIVAKSQATDSFGINDPGYSNRPTLDSYSNSFLALNSYKPTFTDLSYLLLVLNYGNNLKVYDSIGNEIVGFTYIEESIIDIIDGVSKSGEALVIFQYPTPMEGVYRVEITGNKSPFMLKSYFYDQNGNLIDDEIITTEENIPTALNLYYDTNPNTVAVEVLPANISNQKSTTPSDSSATITWSTNRITTSRVIYDTISHSTLGFTPNYGYKYTTSTFDENFKVLDHSLTITGLSADTIYYYRVISTGSPSAISEEYTFKTLSIAGPPDTSNLTYQSNEIVSTNFNKSINKFLGNNIFSLSQTNSFNETLNNNILGKMDENSDFINNKTFIVDNKNSFISIFFLLTGILYLQVVKPITGKKQKNK